VYDLSTVRHIRTDLPNPAPIRFDLSNTDFDWAKREPIDLILPSFRPPELHFFPYSQSAPSRWSIDPFYIDFPWKRPSPFEFQWEENLLSSLAVKDYSSRDLTQFIRSGTPFFRPCTLELPELEFHIPASRPDYLWLPPIELNMPRQEPIRFELGADTLISQ
jgi:hypothetical protein